jgi:hypothetical protein
MEAEHAFRNTPGRSHTWRRIHNNADYLGEGMLFAAPDGKYNASDHLCGQPRLDYRVRIDKPGTYHLWVRGGGRYYNSDAVFVAVDGESVRTLGTGWTGGCGWEAVPGGGFTIKAPGVHTVNVWMREDGTYLDRLLLTSKPPKEYEPVREKSAHGKRLGPGPAESRVVRGGKVGTYAELVAPPPPVTARWSSLRPVMAGPTRAVMEAERDHVVGRRVEYRFEETTGNPGGSDGTWQKEPRYEDRGLQPGKEYAYRFKVRETGGRESNWSEVVRASWQKSPAFVQGRDGVCVIEAESYTRKTPAAGGFEWVKRAARENEGGESAMVTSLLTGELTLANRDSARPRMDYRIRFNRAGKHWLWMRGRCDPKCTHGLWMNDGVTVGLDFAETGWARDFSFHYGLKWLKTKAFVVDKPGVHVLNVWMHEDGVQLDKIVVTDNPDYMPAKKRTPEGRPEGPGPAESPKK